MALIDIVRDRLRKFIMPEYESTPVRQLVGYDNLLAPAKGWLQMMSEWYSSSQDRLACYRQYDYLDENLVEASSALDVYADGAVSGGKSGEDPYYVMLDEHTRDLEQLQQVVNEAEHRTNLKQVLWEMARHLVKYGDVFVELVLALDQTDSNRLYLAKLKTLPVSEMWVDADEYGNFRNKEMPYYQIPVTGQRVNMDWWRVVHMKIGTGVYGYHNSLFSKAAQRIGRQLVWIDEALVLARLSRAWQRNAFFIDTGKLMPDEAMEFVERFMTRLKTRATADSEGRLRQQYVPPMPDEDIGIPVGENAKADVRPLSGDPNVAQIRDVEYLQKKFLIQMKIPKAYIAMEGETRTRATLEQIDVQFARQVRRRQKDMAAGLRKIYHLVFALAGRDPESFDWDITWTDLGAADERLKWEVEALKSQVAKTLAVDVGVVNSEYIWREVLGWDDEMIQKYAPKPSPSEATTSSISLPTDVRGVLMCQEEIRALVEDIADIIATKERMAGKVLL